MKQFVTDIWPLIPATIRILELIALMVCRKEIILFLRDMLSDDGKILSSRRGIAFGAAATLFDLCINHYKDVSTTILWLLVTLIVLCLGLATLPQIIDLWGKIKNAIPGGSPAQAPEVAPATLKVSTEISQS